MEYRVRAYNRAVDHPNKVHDPEYARSIGFRGGIVPGVDVFAYMAHPVCQAWGLGWLEGGALEARFTRPVYDDDELAVLAEPDGDRFALQVMNALGEVCATGRAERSAGDPAPDPAAWPERPLPLPPPPASREAFEAAELLGSLESTLSEAAARAQLEEVREGLGAFAETRTVHPGHLLRLADAVISANVELPPWMHVSSRARFLRSVHWGDTLSVRARVAGLFERKGHRFVELDVLALRHREPQGSRPAGPGEPVFRVQPYTAIYRPAFVD